MLVGEGCLDRCRVIACARQENVLLHAAGDEVGKSILVFEVAVSILVPGGLANVYVGIVQEAFEGARRHLNVASVGLHFAIVYLAVRQHCVGRRKRSSGSPTVASNASTSGERT